MARLKKHKKQIQPDAVISFMESSNFVNLISGKTGKTIISVRNLKSKLGEGFLGKISKALIKRLYKKSDLIVAVSKGVKADLVKNFQLEEGKIKVIYNPYNISLITKQGSEPLEERFNNIFQSPVVITVGSLIKQKGQWHLIRAFKNIKASNPDMKLVILGEGNLRPYLEKLVVELKMEDDIIMPGFNSNPFKFIKKSTIFVLPSLFEGFPNVLLEAMALGLPVVSSDCQSGPREILAPNTAIPTQTEKIEFAEYGLLVPVCFGKYYNGIEPLTKEEGILAEAVNRLINDTHVRAKYSQKSIERAEDFAVSRIVQQWVELIEI